MAPNTQRLTAIELDRLVAAAAPAVAEIADGIYAVRVCERATAQALIGRAAASVWRAATINADLAVDPAVRSADVLDEIGASALTEVCREHVFAATKMLAAQLAPGALPAEIQIVRYAAGGRYIEHRDSPAAGATPRRLSVVWYLNDDFGGGETCFANPDLCVTPACGIAIAFLPERLHRAEAVTGGTKYAVTAWYHARPGRVR